MAQQRCQNEGGEVRNLLGLLMVEIERLGQTSRRRRRDPASGGVQLRHMTEHRGDVQPLSAFHHSPFRDPGNTEKSQKLGPMKLQ